MELSLDFNLLQSPLFSVPMDKAFSRVLENVKTAQVQFIINAQESLIKMTSQRTHDQKRDFKGKQKDFFSRGLF